MTAQLSTVADALLFMVPSFAACLLICLVWYLICRILMRRQDADWNEKLPQVTEEVQGGSYDLQIKHAQFRLASLLLRANTLGRGKPSDRMFLFGLLIASGLAVTSFLFLLVVNA